MQVNDAAQMQVFDVLLQQLLKLQPLTNYLDKANRSPSAVHNRAEGQPRSAQIAASCPANTPSLVYTRKQAWISS
jgi:hypothetical protein